METLTCPKCGAVDKYYTELKSNNNVARCNLCDAYIKNTPYEQPRFHFGKYKGELVKDITDISYLKWVLENTKQSATMRTAIQKQIDDYEFLSK